MKNIQRRKSKLIEYVLRYNCFIKCLKPRFEEGKPGVLEDHSFIYNKHHLFLYISTMVLILWGYEKVAMDRKTWLECQRIAIETKKRYEW